MSRFCALVRPSTTGLAAEATRVLEAMPVEGAQERAVWADADAALGATVPTSPVGSECPPVSGGGLAVVGDVRLDNRDELAHELSGTIRELGVAGVRGDGPLVLASFARWGDAAVERLVGAFAFVVWDARRKRLVAVRDPIGIRPLFYHDGGDFVAFGSEPYGVLAARGVPRAIDEAQVAEAITQRLFDPVRTSFVGVDKLQAGHLMVWESARATRRRYWTPQPRPPSGLDHAEEFRSLFDRAVRDRLRTPAAVAVELSGGLDSTAVAVTAAQMTTGLQGPLRALSARFDRTARVDESPYIDAALAALPDVEAHSFYPDRETFVDLYAEIFERAGAYRLGSNIHLNYLSARAASQTGAGVLLTGHDGDTTVGHGWELFVERATSGRGAGLYGEAEALTARLAAELDSYDGQFTFRTPAAVANGLLVPALRQFAEDNQFGRAWRVARALVDEFGASPAVVAKRMVVPVILPPALHRYRRLRAAKSRAAQSIPTVVPKGTALAARLSDRLAADDHASREGQRPVVTAAGKVAQALTLHFVGTNFERLDALTAPFGVEARHPFMDVRLIEFSLGLPVEERLRGGYTRSILRRALGDRLPSEVAQRANKAHLGAAYDRLVLSDPGRLAAVISGAGAAAPSVDTHAALELLARPEKLSGDEILWVANAVTTVLWASGPRVRAALGPSAHRE